MILIDNWWGPSWAATIFMVPRKLNMAPEKWWLGDSFPFGIVDHQVGILLWAFVFHGFCKTFWLDEAICNFDGASIRQSLVDPWWSHVIARLDRPIWSSQASVGSLAVVKLDGYHLYRWILRQGPWAFCARCQALATNFCGYCDVSLGKMQWITCKRTTGEMQKKESQKNSVPLK